MTYTIAFAIGVFASVGAFILHKLIHFIEHIVTEGFLTEKVNWLYLVYPTVGIFLTMLLVKYVVRDNISHGITRVLYAISTNNSRIKRHNCWSSIVASALTIGFGGSVGAEAPIVLAGSAIGSSMGQLFKMKKHTVMLLVGCGGAAGIAGIFKAPITGLVFGMEVLMIDISMASLMPMLIACITADVMSYIFTGTSSMFTFHLDHAFSVDRVPACILLGVFCGLMSLYFIRMMTFCEGIFGKMKNHPYRKLALGGIVLSCLIFLFPSLYGQGYTSIAEFIKGQTMADWGQVMNGSLFYGHADLLLAYIGLTMLTKIIATSCTNGAGGCGGTFAPSLFVGGFAGFFFSRLWNFNQIGTYLPEKNFTLLGMAGIIAGVMHAPLTGVFLIAEITGGYQLFVPLIIVCIVSVMVISIFEPHGIYSMRLAREGKLVSHHTDRSVLTLMNMSTLMEKDMTTVSPEMNMGKLVNVLTSSNDSFIPVTDSSDRLLGIIDINKIRHLVFRSELYQRVKVSQLMTPVNGILYDNEPMEEVMDTFDKTNADALPVVDINNRLKGYISRARMYRVYRQLVEDFSAE